MITYPNLSAEGLRAESSSVSAATPPAAVRARAGGFSFSFGITPDHRSDSAGATDACHAGVFDTSRPAALGVRALHEQTGGRT